MIRGFYFRHCLTADTATFAPGKRVNFKTPYFETKNKSITNVSRRLLTPRFSYFASPFVPLRQRRGKLPRKTLHLLNIIFYEKSGVLNLQVIPKALADNRNRVPAYTDNTTVVRYDDSALKTSMLLSMDTSAVKRRSITIHHDLPPADQNPVHAPKKSPSEQLESITTIQERLCETARSISLERDELSGCRNTNLQDRDTSSAQRNNIPLQQDSPPVQRNRMPFAADSVKEQPRVVPVPLSMPKTVQFHQFRYFNLTLSSNHTHGDSHITTLFLYPVARRHNASFSFTRQ